MVPAKIHNLPALLFSSCSVFKTRKQPLFGEMSNGDLVQTCLPDDPQDICRSPSGSDCSLSPIQAQSQRPTSPPLFADPPSPKRRRLERRINLDMEQYTGRSRRAYQRRASTPVLYEVPRWMRGDEENDSQVLASETPSSLSSFPHTPSSSTSRVSNSNRSSSTSSRNSRESSFSARTTSSRSLSPSPLSSVRKRLSSSQGASSVRKDTDQSGEESDTACDKDGK